MTVHLPSEIDPTDDFQTLLHAFRRPARNLEDSWHYATSLEKTARLLFEQGRHQEAIELTLAVADLNPMDSHISDTGANVLQWATWHSYNSYVTERALALAERGKFAFTFNVEKLVKKNAGLPFFVSAFMPKSGGTYIATSFERAYGYRQDIFYVFGGDMDNMISPARASALAVLGGVINHTHLAPSAWNFTGIRDLGVPVWIHVRDPRDCFLSLLNMVQLEAERGGPNAAAFYSTMDWEIGGAGNRNLPKTEIGTKLYRLFSYYCRWLRGWLDFEYDRKLVTFHSDLASNEAAFFESVSRALHVTALRAPGETAKSYSTTRFFQGTNARWKSELGYELIDRMTAEMDAGGLRAPFVEPV